MKLSRTTGALTAVLIMACASTPPALPPAPVNAPGVNPTPTVPTQPPTAPTTPTPLKHVGSWTFAYVPGNYTYTLKTDATIAPAGDTTQKQSVPELNQQATITIFNPDSILVVEPAATPPAACDASTALITRMRKLIPMIPDHLATGDTWRDTTTTNGCRGMIPAESTTISNYTVLGDTTIQNIPVIQIARTDSLSATGEGVDGQHRILISATGVGRAYLFLDFTTGRLISLTGTQTALVNVTTSGRLAPFIQHVTESISITGLR